MLFRSSSILIRSSLILCIKGFTIIDLSIAIASEICLSRFNSLNFAVGAIDVFNYIKVISTSPEGVLIIQNDENKPSVRDPNSEGFLGYRKMFRQIDAIGSVPGVQKRVYQYTQFYQPPFTIKFETFGLPMRAFDIANIDGQNIIIINLSHTINAKDNKWWMTVEGEWIGDRQTGRLAT